VTPQKKKYRIIFFATFAIALAYFFFSSSWHIPSRLVLAGTSISGSEIRVGWDSGSGFNELEAAVVDAGIPIQRESNEHIITVKRTGEKNPSSSSTRVYLMEIIKDGQEQYIDDFDYKAGVSLLSNRLIYIESDGTAFSFEARINSDIQLRFLTNSESGYVEVSLDGDGAHYDLYSEKDGDRAVYRRVRKCVPGEFTVSIDLPRYAIRRIKADAFETGGRFELTSAAIVSERGTIDLPISEKGVVSTYFFSGFDRGTRKYYHPIRFCFQLVFAGFIGYLSVCLVRFAGRRGGLKAVITGGDRPIFWLMFGGAVGIFSLWLIAYWPGNLTTDSIDIWRTAQIPGGIKNDHPFLNMVYYKFLQQIWNHVAVVGIFQILATAVLGAYIFYFVHTNGVSLAALIPFYLLFVFSTPIGLYNIILWKDVPFALLVLFWAFYLARLYFRKQAGHGQISYEMVVVMFVTITALCLIRYNGVIYFFVIPSIMLIFGLLPAKKMAMIAVMAASSIAISVFLFSAVANTDFVLRQTGVYFDYLKTLRPVSTVRTVSKKYPNVLDISRNRTQSDPWIKDRMGVEWHQYFTKRRGYTDFVKYHRHAPLSASIFTLMDTLHKRSYKPPWVYFSWNPFYLLWLFPLALVAFRNFPMSAIFSFMILSQVVFLLAVFVTMNWRYYYFLLVSSNFLVPLAMLDLKMRKKRG